MAKMNYADMSIPEMIAIQKELAQEISTRTQIQSMQDRLLFKTGDKAKVVGGYKKKLIGTVVELVNVGKTRARFDVEGKPHYWQMAWLERVEDKAPVAEAAPKAKK